MGYTGNNHHAQKYDAAKAYDKNLPALERLHYLENSQHDKHAAKMYGDPPAKNSYVTADGSVSNAHSPAPKMYDDAAPKFTDGLRAASADGKLSGKFKQAVDAAPKMAGQAGHNVVVEDITPDSQSIVGGDMGYAGDASGAPDPTRPNTGNNPARMIETLAKPAAMMKKGIASMCGMKK